MGPIMKWSGGKSILVILVMIFLAACGSDTLDPDPETGDTGEVQSSNDTGVDDTGENVRPDMGPTTDMQAPPDMSLFDFGAPPDMEEDTGPAFLSVSAVVPPRGSVDGETPVVVEGTGFSENTVVFFGARQAELEFIDGRMVGQTPPASSPGPVTVKVLDPAFEGPAILADGYEYISTLRVDSLIPTQSPTTGGIEVTIDGRGFDEFTRISFGGQTALRHTVVSSNVMRVLTPPVANAGLVDLRATSRDSSVVVEDAMLYFAPLSLDSIRPASAATAGMVDVDLYGTGFANGMQVEFDSVVANVNSVGPNGETANVRVPAHPAGLVDVSIRTDVDALVAPDAFYYAAAATFSVAALSPEVGVAAGGTEVTIIGSAFDGAGLSVEFDGIPATQIVDSGPGFVTAWTPAHAPGQVDVTVSAGGNTGTLVDAFTYVDDIWVDNVTPASGSSDGGYPVTINGEGFTGATRVEFGGVAASDFTVVSDTQITATAPAHSAGTVDVVVERGEVSARFRDAFTFSEPLEVFGFSPVRGSIAGNTYVKIFGRGFVAGTQVSFDAQAATTIEVLDPQTMVVRTPAHPTGPVDLEVDNSVENVIADDPYTYYNPGARFGGAWGAPVDGSVNVTVFELGGAPVENAFVMLSTNAETPYQGFTDANGMITLSGPDVLGEQTVTAVAAGLSSGTVQRVDAENITIFLQPPPPPPEGGGGEGASATFTGKVIGVDKIAEPELFHSNIVIVRTTRVDRSTRNPDPGGANIVRGDGQEYVLNSRVGDLALVAIGGVSDDLTGEFEPRIMGVKRFQVAADGMTYTRDIEMTIPLDQTATFKLDQPPRGPQGPTTNEIVPWLDFGFEGVFGELPVASGDADIITADQMPLLAGDLAGVSVTAIGGAITPGGGPSSVAFARNITNFSQIIAMPPLMGIAQVTSPTAGNTPTDGLVQFSLNTTNQPDFIYAIVVDFNFAPVWEVFLPGDARSFRLPTFPDFSSLPADQRPTPYPNQQLILQILTISSPGFDFNTVSYTDLSPAGWDAYGINGILFNL